MLAVRRRSRYAFFALLFHLFGAALARSQDASPSPAHHTWVRPRAVRWLEKCPLPSTGVHFFMNRARNSELAAFPGLLLEDDPLASGIDATCAPSSSAPADSPSPVAKPDTSCLSSAALSSHDSACPSPADPISGQLDSLGKPGAEIRSAREETLEILQSPNACSAWFAAKDPDVDRTFHSLGFLIDQQGPSDVLASFSASPYAMIRQPYVARATQDGGANTEITINAHGAFYRKLAKVQKVNSQGGPDLPSGQQWLTVGAYTGNTLQAQILTLLHELGHVIDLLPEDADDLDGKSAKNTSEVLRHCRPVIEAFAKHNREIAKR